VIGLVVGLGVSTAASKLVQGLLFKIGSTDVLTYAVVAGLIVATALVSCLLPSRRALRADPARIFRGS
jgi:ABC-type antimicrobial peptide transport system permease subunit